MNVRKNNGITLIILIVTIIVLLILAGVTISTITGGENTMEKASDAKLSTEAKAEMEEIQKAIDTSASKGIRYGNYSGSVDAKTIQGELKDLVTDTSMITGVGPWKVTGSKTGTNYLIKQSYEVIAMPENTGSLTEMKVKTGDYVNYTAGNWTQEDIDKLGNLYSGENIPDSTKPYTFGGFKVGQSKDVGIIQGENNASVQDNEHAGWRVLSFNDDGSINIIHAGAPEWYYQARYYPKIETGGAARSAARGQYILEGTKIDETWETAYENVFPRIWNMYENTTYVKKDSARSITRVELKANGGYSWTSTWYRLIGINFWTTTGYTSGGGIFWCALDETKTKANVNNYGRDTSAGIRPVVTLKAECLYQNTNDENTTTHDTQDTAWNLII